MKKKEWFGVNETERVSLGIWRLLEPEDLKTMYNAGIRVVCVDDLRFELLPDGQIK